MAASLRQRGKIGVSLALHRALFEAQFAVTPHDPYVPGSPILAALCNRVVDALTLLDPRWADWRSADQHADRVAIAEQHLLANPRWNQMSREQRTAQALNQLAPLVPSDSLISRLVGDQANIPCILRNQGTTEALGATMSVVEMLMESAKADTDLLRSLDSQGDNFASPRDVDFLLRAPSREKAEAASGFINDFQFGVAALQEADGQYSVKVIINMAIQQHAILSVSGFMGCICALFGLDYDGWGCVAQVHA